MGLSILQKDLEKLLEELVGHSIVYGPTEDKAETFSKYRFKKLKKAKDLKIGYGPTVIPPKKYLFPARVDILNFEKGEVFPPTNREFILFGINKRDGEGLFYLDEIMSKPIPEEDYLKRRENMKIIIIDALSPSNALHCDLYLQKISENQYLAFPFTEFGQTLTQKKYFGYNSQAGALTSRNLEDEIIFHPRLTEIIAGSRDHEIWNRLAEKCLNCGICSYVCPLCYCFEIDDKVEITTNTAEDKKGVREKRWDSCMLPEFASVSFKNFRPELKDRIYNWYYHKFYRMPLELGFPGCVDCGRCIQFCPAKINYREVLKELIEDEKFSKLHSK